MRVLVLVALAACGGPAVPQAASAPSSARLAPPPSGDPSRPGAAYLTAVAAQLQSRWHDFLEDCRLRLPATHPLNARALAATFELGIARGGAIALRQEIATSGNGDFDTAVSDVLADASPLPDPPADLVSDDELVHLRWQFARDRRQAGAATARVVMVELPLADAVDRLLARGQLVRAAQRIARAPQAAPERAATAERVMLAALREALTGPNGAARRTAVEACGRASLHALADAVRLQLSGASDPELRLAAIHAAGALADRAAAPVLLAGLHDDLAQRSRSALPRIAALVAIGQAQPVAEIVRQILDGGPNPVALAALVLVPVPALAPRLAGWAAHGDIATRGAVCAALPAAAPARATALIVRGLRDPDATVRATCADAATREDRARPDPAMVQRLHALARDRDRSVRARAVVAIGLLDPAHPVRAADDPAPEVRAAFAKAAAPAELRVLAVDRDPEVRAAALTALGDRAGELAARAARDPSPAVRRAAIALIDDAAVLAQLARDDSPEVATAALVRATMLRGRAAAITPLLDQLAAAPAGSTERARIALAWLLAP